MVTVGRNDKRWREICSRLRRTLPPVCWICGADIDLSISGREKWGWTLDHVNPLAQAPALALDESNLRPAHNICNATRGGRGVSSTKYSQKWG